MKNNAYILVLNRIKYKPIIIEGIFPFLLNRPYILDNLISKDDILKKKLNQIFSNVKRRSNKLEEEFRKSLEYLLLLRDMKHKINEWFEQIKNKPLTYKFLKNEINNSFLKYLVTKLKIHNYSIINGFFDNDYILEGIVKEYYVSLKKVNITYLPDKHNYIHNIDIKYLEYLDEANNHSRKKNRINQKIKLILILDENKFYTCNKRIKYPNINEIEFIFDNENISKENILIYFSRYLSNIEHLENINKIIFHNKIYENYLTNNYNTDKINKEYYQSLITYLFDDSYSEENKNAKIQIKLLSNLKEIIIENIPFLYIYEKMKLYYSINELFPYISSKIINPNVNNDKTNLLEINIPFYINDKIMIINNKDKNIKLNELLFFIEYYINNANIEYLMIVNHCTLIKDETKNKEINNTKIKINTLKEFIYISETSENFKDFIDIITLSISDSKKNKNNKYEGYNKNGELIVYRVGETQIQSFDLIDLFKYNKKLVQLKFINENLIINYNEERTKLEIINKEKNNCEINKIIKANNYLTMKHFSQFIYNQRLLNELSINQFDINLNDIRNNNIRTLNLNYENEMNIIQYNINCDENEKLDVYFPNIINLNIGGNSNNVFNLLHKILSNKLKTINIISNKEKTNYFTKVLKKINSYKIENNIYEIEDGDDNEENNNKQYFEDEEEYEEYEDEEY